MTITTIETKVSHKIVNSGYVTAMRVDFSPHRFPRADISISFSNGAALNIPIPSDVATSMGHMMGGAVKMTLEFTEPTLTTTAITN